MARASESIFQALLEATRRPRPFECYTAADLWTDEHTSAQMLKYHLDASIDLSSRNHAFIDRSVSWMVDRFEVGPETANVDFGCGPGLYTIRLARRGAQVTGIDFSRRSIDYAKESASRENLTARYIHGDYLEHEWDERFDLATLIFCDFCALSPAQRATLLDTIGSVLEPDGSLLLDVHSLAAFRATQESSACERNQLDGFWSPDEYVALVHLFKYEPERVVLHKYTIVERDRVRSVYNWLQYFDLPMLERELAEHGLVIRGVYADVAGAPYAEGAPEIAVVAGRQR